MRDSSEQGEDIHVSPEFPVQNININIRQDDELNRACESD